MDEVALGYCKTRAIYNSITSLIVGIILFGVCYLVYSYYYSNNKIDCKIQKGQIINKLSKFQNSYSCDYSYNNKTYQKEIVDDKLYDSKELADNALKESIGKSLSINNDQNISSTQFYVILFILILVAILFIINSIITFVTRADENTCAAYNIKQTISGFAGLFVKK